MKTAATLAVLCLVLGILAPLPRAHASGTINPGGTILTIYGTIIPLNVQIDDNAQGYGNGTVLFNLTTTSSSQILQFVIAPFGNGTMTLLFQGPTPCIASGAGVTVLSTPVYLNGKERISWASLQSVSLTVTYGGAEGLCLTGGGGAGGGSGGAGPLSICITCLVAPGYVNYLLVIVLLAIGFIILIGTLKRKRKK